jgi:hypothetical protein
MLVPDRTQIRPSLLRASIVAAVPSLRLGTSDIAQLLRNGVPTKSNAKVDSFRFISLSDHWRTLGNVKSQIKGYNDGVSAGVTQGHWQYQQN